MAFHRYRFYSLLSNLRMNGMIPIYENFSGTFLIVVKVLFISQTQLHTLLRNGPVNVPVCWYQLNLLTCSTMAMFAINKLYSIIGIGFIRLSGTKKELPNAPRNKYLQGNLRVRDKHEKWMREKRLTCIMDIQTYIYPISKICRR